MITEIEDYFSKGCDRCARFDTPDCATQIWAEGLAQLRDLCRNAGLSEHVKWGHPCYMHAGRNIAILGAFRDDFRLNFMNAGLLSDPEGVLVAQGPNSATRTSILFTDVEQVRVEATIIRTYLRELMDHAEHDTKPPKTVTDYAVPEELTDALDADPALAQAFEALTPGRQRGYYMHIGRAKQSATRTARVEKLRDRIFAGIGYNERR